MPLSVTFPIVFATEICRFDPTATIADPGVNSIGTGVGVGVGLALGATQGLAGALGVLLGDSLAVGVANCCGLSVGDALGAGLAVTLVQGARLATGDDSGAGEPGGSGEALVCMRTTARPGGSACAYETPIATKLRRAAIMSEAERCIGVTETPWSGASKH